MELVDDTYDREALWLFTVRESAVILFTPLCGFVVDFWYSLYQETRWRGSGCRFFGAIGNRYQLFWMGSKAKTDGVGIL